MNFEFCKTFVAPFSFSQSSILIVPASAFFYSKLFFFLKVKDVKIKPSIYRLSLKSSSFYPKFFRLPDNSDYQSKERRRLRWPLRRPPNLRNLFTPRHSFQQFNSLKKSLKQKWPVSQALLLSYAETYSLWCSSSLTFLE